jgi:hypothetical protein
MRLISWIQPRGSETNSMDIYMRVASEKLVIKDVTEIETTIDTNHQGHQEHHKYI